MIKAVYALAAAGVALAPISATAAGQDDVQKLFDKASEVFKEKGFVETGWQQKGMLKTGGETTYTVTLKDGVQALVGVCDGNCDNIDMYVSKGGTEVDKDVEDDDFPIVVVNQAGTYTVRMVMKNCKTDSCAIGVKGYKQQ